MLKKHFELFLKLGSEEEKSAFWAAFQQEFEMLDPAEQQKVRDDFEENLHQIDKRLNEIASQLAHFQIS